MNRTVFFRLVIRYLFWDGGHKTVRLARRLTMGAIVAAVAAFLVAVSISTGFESELQGIVTRFGPHVVVMPDGPGADPVEALGVIAGRRITEEETALWKRWRWMMPPMETLSHLYGRLDEWLWEDKDGSSLLRAFVRVIHPFRLADWLEERAWIPHLKIEEIAQGLRLAEAGVVEWSRFLAIEGLVVGSGEARGVLLKGIDEVGMGHLKSARLDPPLDRWGEGGGWGEGGDGRTGVYVGTTLARELGKREVRCLTADRWVDLQIVGTFETGLFEYDSRLVLARLADVQGMATRSTPVGFDLWLDDPRKGRYVAQGISGELDSYHVLSWDEIYGNVFQALATEKKVFGVLVSILLALCCFQLMGEHLTFSWETRVSWGLFKGLGLRDGPLKKLLYGRSIGLTLGALLAGIGLGVGLIVLLQEGLKIALPSEIYFLDHVPGHISKGDVGLVIGLALIFSWAAARLGIGRTLRRPIVPLLHKGL